jgi:hypothetical protein
MVSGSSLGAIVALVGGNDAKVLMRKAEPAICADIEAKVKAFWASIEAGTEPRPDFDRDGEYLRKNMIFVTEGKVLDADEQMQKDIETLIDAKAKMASYEKIVDGLQAKLLYAAGDAEKITSPLGSGRRALHRAKPWQTGDARHGWHLHRRTRRLPAVPFLPQEGKR